MHNKQDNPLKALPHDISELPFHRFLGLSLECFDTENGCIRFEMRDELVGNSHFKILHGGVIATLLDAEGAFVLALDGKWRPETDSPENPPVIKGGTIDLRVDYLTYRATE